MSIFNDPKLRKTLEVYGSEFINKFGQPAQQDDAVAYQIAKPLLIQLQRQVDPENAPKANLLGTSEGSLPELKTTSLVNIESFLSWCSVNKVTWNNKLIAYEISDTSAPDDSLEFGKFKASPTELSAFLSHLRDSDESKKNKMFSSMLDRIIAKANESLETPIPARKTKSTTPGSVSETRGPDGKPIPAEAAKMAADVTKVVKTLPLVLWTYNFPKIKIFLETLKELMPVPTEGQIISHNDMANQNLQAPNKDQIMYLQSAANIAAFAVNPQQAVLTYLDHIQTVTELVQGVIVSFAQTQKLDEQEKALINQQVDPSRGIAYQNINQMTKLMEQAKKK